MADDFIPQDGVRSGRSPKKKRIAAWLKRFFGHRHTWTRSVDGSDSAGTWSSEAAIDFDAGNEKFGDDQKNFSERISIVDDIRVERGPPCNVDFKEKERVAGNPLLKMATKARIAHSNDRLALKFTIISAGTSTHGDGRTLAVNMESTERRSDVKEGLAVASRFCQTVITKLPACVDDNPLKMALSVLRTIIEIKNDIGDNRDSLQRNLSSAAEVLAVVERATSFKVPSLLRASIVDFETLTTKWTVTKILDYEEHKKRIQIIVERIKDATTTFQTDMIIGIQVSASQIQADIKRAALERLSPSPMADHHTIIEDQSLRRERCTPGTRVYILEQLTSWANDTSKDSPCVFWLTGQAGSGKTTIAYTMAKLFDSTNALSRRDKTTLGGNFLCSRQFAETRERTRIVRTLAYQLAEKCPSYAAALHVTDKFSIANHEVDEQLRDLLVQPWLQSGASTESSFPYLIIIDALDEMQGDGGSTFLRALFNAVNEYSLQGLKFLVTSRTDPDIVALCESFDLKTIFRLQEVKIEEATLDIDLYLRQELPGLVGSPLLSDLAMRAAGLFIYAATAVKLLTAGRKVSSKEQAKMLDRLLSQTDPHCLGVNCRGRIGQAKSLIENLYHQILEDAFAGFHGESLDQRLRILHTILSVPERTSPSVVAALCADGDEEAVQAVVESLHSVLYIQGDRIFWYHASFQDFVFDAMQSNYTGDKPPPIVHNGPSLHSTLVESCLSLMEGLRLNIAKVTSSFLQSKAEGLQDRIPVHIDPHPPASISSWICGDKLRQMSTWGGLNFLLPYVGIDL